MGLKVRDAGGRETELINGSGHWIDTLNTASFISVWKMFSDKPYSEKSQMEGRVIHELPDGTFRAEPPPWNMPTGFSALDLYAMGLLAAEEVPDTFLVRNPVETRADSFQGDKYVVRIQDVILAMGKRVPDVSDSQKKFTLGMYLLHEGGRAPDAEKMRQAEGIEKALIEYFEAATGGRMRVMKH